MARRCSITGKGVQSGNKVSHSNRKTRRRFLPNLQNISFLSDALAATVRLRVSMHTLRSITKNGGLDAFLLKTSNLKLEPEAVQLKRRIKKAMVAKGEAVVEPKKQKKAA